MRLYLYLLVFVKKDTCYVMIMWTGHVVIWHISLIVSEGIRQVWCFLMEREVSQKVLDLF